MNMLLVKHFPVRNLKFFKKNSSKTHYWMGNSAGLTYAMLALSVMFPAGERFFIICEKIDLHSFLRNIIISILILMACQGG